MSRTVKGQGRKRLMVAAAGIALASLLVTAPAVAGKARTERVSMSRAGGEANGHSRHPSISGNGRFVAFQSFASNLVPGDTARVDVFVRDLKTGRMRRVSIGLNGNEPNASSLDPSISAGGRFVAFSSFASNLVEGDTNRAQDVFVKDLETRETQRVSVSTDDEEASEHSGRLNEDEVASISADGRFVAFSSDASNLVEGDTNDDQDVFVRDLETGQTQRVSLGSRPSAYPSISADGRFVAFECCPFGGIYVRDLMTGRTRRVGPGREPSISAHGRLVAFYSSVSNLHSSASNLHSSASNPHSSASRRRRGQVCTECDVLVRDLRTGRKRNVSIAFDGSEADHGSFSPSISADGRFVAFYSYASNLVRRDTARPDVFVRDLKARTTRRMGVGRWPAISSDARFVAFVSRSRRLVSGHPRPFWNIYRRGPLR
jgi:Tol biopolymer transport system component